jgi:hypothetical protein
MGRIERLGCPGFRVTNLDLGRKLVLHIFGKSSARTLSRELPQFSLHKMGWCSAALGPFGNHGDQKRSWVPRVASTKTEVFSGQVGKLSREPSPGCRAIPTQSPSCQRRMGDPGWGAGTNCVQVSSTVQPYLWHKPKGSEVTALGFFWTSLQQTCPKAAHWSEPNLDGSPAPQLLPILTTPSPRLRAQPPQRPPETRGNR